MANKDLQKELSERYKQKLKKAAEEHDKQKLKKAAEEHDKQKLKKAAKEHDKQKLKKAAEEHDKKKLKKAAEKHGSSELKKDDLGLLNSIGDVGSPAVKQHRLAGIYYRLERLERLKKLTPESRDNAVIEALWSLERRDFKQLKLIISAQKNSSDSSENMDLACYYRGRRQILQNIAWFALAVLAAKELIYDQQKLKNELRENNLEGERVSSLREKMGEIEKSFEPQKELADSLYKQTEQSPDYNDNLTKEDEETEITYQKLCENNKEYLQKLIAKEKKLYSNENIPEEEEESLLKEWEVYEWSQENLNSMEDEPPQEKLRLLPKYRSLLLEKQKDFQSPEAGSWFKKALYIMKTLPQQLKHLYQHGRFFTPPEKHLQEQQRIVGKIGLKPSKQNLHDAGQVDLTLFTAGFPR